jgi:hypothetical protein
MTTPSDASKRSKKKFLLRAAMAGAGATILGCSSVEAGGFGSSYEPDASANDASDDSPGPAGSVAEEGGAVGVTITDSGVPMDSGILVEGGGNRDAMVDAGISASDAGPGDAGEGG